MSEVSDSVADDDVADERGDDADDAELADLADDAEPSDDADLADLAEVSDEVLRRSLDLALAVASAGARTRPPVAASPSIRPFLRFQRAPSSAFGAIRAVLNDDVEFRRRVSTIATVELVGPTGMLWLNRPAGWRRAMLDLVRGHSGESSEQLASEGGESERVGDREGRSREPAALTKAERRRREAGEHNAAKAAAELASLRTSIEAERGRRAALERTMRQRDETIKRLSRQLAEAETASVTARQRLAQAVEGREQRESEIGALQRALGVAESARDAALAGRAAAEAVSVADVSTGRRANDDAVRQRDADQLLTAEQQRSQQQATRAVQSTAEELRQLAASLDAAARLIDTGRTSDVGEMGTFSHQPMHRRRSRTARREPLAIPGGLHGDTAAAAIHLLRHPGVLVIVDGYNVAMLGWQELKLEQQRSALLQALDDLVRRHGTRILVVFDGTDVGTIAGPGTGRRLVRVVFSEHGVTADDEIRRLVSMQPVRQPIVVVTNDRAIVNDVRQHGVNPVSSDVLLAVIRR